MGGHEDRIARAPHCFLRLGVGIALSALLLVLAVRAVRPGGEVAALAAEKTAFRVLGDGTDSQRLILNNRSARPVTVMGFNASCSCVIVDSCPLTVPPRGSAYLTIRGRSIVDTEVDLEFFTNRAPGRLHARVHVAGHNPRAQVTAQPNQFTLHPESGASETVIVRNPTGGVVQLLGVISSRDCLAVLGVPAVLPPGGEHRVVVSVSSPAAGPVELTLSTLPEDQRVSLHVNVLADAPDGPGTARGPLE